MKAADLAAAVGKRNRSRLLEAVAMAGDRGVSTLELRHALNLGESSVGAHLRALLSSGAVVKVPPDGVSVRWYLPERAPEWKRLEIVERRRQQRARQAAAWVESSPVRRVVAAESQKPPKTRGVRSVWELA